MHIMLKLSLVFALVILSHYVFLAHGADDEFAEFEAEFEENHTEEPAIQKLKSTDRLDDSPKGKQGVNKEQGDHQPESDHTSPRTTIEEDIDTEGKAKTKPDLKLVNAPLPYDYKWESYYVEIAFILACFLYFVNFFLGSAKNQTFAQNWYEQSRDLLKQQFVLVGGAPTLNEGNQKKDEDSEPVSSKKQRGLIKSTESMYTLWCSGRVGLDGMLVEINLLKRQDLFSMALNLFKLSKDHLILRFLLNQDGYENFVFCLAHRTHATKLARDMIDINTFCSKRKPLSQCGTDIDKLYALSELSDVTSFILDSKTVSFLKKHEQSINYIHITDQYSTVRNEDATPAQKLANPKHMATFSFQFPQSKEDREEFVLFSLALIDRLRRFKLARDSKQKSEKNRQKITDILQKTAFSQRQEAAQAKKEELRRKEKERIFSEDDPEKQKRWEKKEAKRELKKSKTRVKQLKVKSM